MNHVMQDFPSAGLQVERGATREIVRYRRQGLAAVAVVPANRKRRPLCRNGDRFLIRDGKIVRQVPRLCAGGLGTFDNGPMDTSALRYVPSFEEWNGEAEKAGSSGVCGVTARKELEDCPSPVH